MPEIASRTPSRITSPLTHTSPSPNTIPFPPGVVPVPWKYVTAEFVVESPVRTSVSLLTLGVPNADKSAPSGCTGFAHPWPGAPEFAGAKRYTVIDDAIRGADVVMALRIQRERMSGAQIPDEATYHRTFGVTRERLRRAKPDAIVMHPGPMNRDVEIASDVADGPQSVIQRQVANGVAVRMAVLAAMVRNVQARRRSQ